MNIFPAESSFKISGFTRLAARCVFALGFSAALAVVGNAQTAQTQKAAAPAGNAQNGKKLFMAYGCYECHGTAAQGAPTGPRLGPHPVPITEGTHELRHPNAMPPYTERVVSDAEIADIYAFLQSLPDPPKADTIPLLK